MKTEGAEKKMVNVRERAVLFNCTKHYQELAELFPSYSESWSKMEAPFGEQAILDGTDADSICIGDVFESGIDAPLRLRVVFPRLGCYRVDRRYPMPDAKIGAKGTVRHWVSANARAGFFCSVERYWSSKMQCPASIGDGDTLKLLERPYPNWTLSRVAQLLYSETPLSVHWKGDDSQLQELCEMPEFGYYEWKDRLLIVRASIKEQRPLSLPKWLGDPVLREEGKHLLVGSWIMGDQCAATSHTCYLEADENGTEAASTESLFGGTKFIGKLRDTAEFFEMDVEMGFFPMYLTMTRAGEQVRLVFSSGAVWTRMPSMEGSGH